ncbi:putative ATP-dependent RNA helicase TDRD12 [Microplitis demolitor]|uniref:putative ATP-dependent RNA helicase TDRD12 n=1 Tax=Microplitis demolitor TaxID=69319 RepID=UPI00235B5CFB|nr:putative ATP-dependent RNA helicase TDRD12 [Microplitis demolitor]
MVVINHKLPANAVEVTVEKITNPNKILIRDVTHVAEKLKLITEKLKVVAKKYKKSEDNVNDKPLAVGTLTIIDRNTPDGINLPAWYSRAIITGFNYDTLKYSAFLVDYGVTFKLCRQAFIVITQDDIPDQYLTESVSLYKIIPAMIKSCNDDGVDLLAKKTWCPEAIDLAKQLISASRKCYFELSAIGRTGKKYGELYLIIENQIILLRKALVKAHTAIFVNEDLLDVKSSDNSFSSAKSISSPALDSGNNTDSNSTSASVNSVAQRVGFEEVLVSSNESCNRLTDIASAKFTKNIHHALNKLSVRRLRNIQSYMWPAINKGLDVMAVAPTKSGKTFGYVAPIANMIVTTRQYQEDGQPMALILCPSSKEVLYIKEHFRLILSDFSDIKIIGAFNGCEYRSITAQVYNGCHIFIATPAFLFRYLEDKNSGAPVKFSSINHLVIDHLDDLLLKHVDTLIPLLKKYTPFGKKKAQSSRLMALQTIAVARQWSSLLGTFTKNAFKNPFYCIGSFADATIFCGIQLRTRSILKAQKLVKTEELLEKNYLLVKTMIVCAEGDEAHELNNYLSSKNIRTLYVPEDVVRAEIVDAKGQWDRGIAGNYEVLICTDRALPILEVTDVDWLIHYSIAVPTKSTFLFRFSTLMTNLRKKSPTTEVTIFIDETNDIQLRSILNLVERSGYKLSAEQKNAFERVYVNLERQKKNYPICDNIKAFGNCEKGNACTFRHCFIAEVDTPMTPVTIGDKVKMTITYVHDATHFSAKIQEYTDSQGNKHMVSAAAHVEIESKVYQYFAAMRNRRKCHTVEVGGIYGYDERLDEYCRVQIINVVKKNDDGKPLVVDLRNIDSGYVYAHQNVSRLREMPKELAEAPAHIVEVFLANISPYDKEIEWNVRANKCTMSWFTEQLEAPCTSLRGTVVLHFGNTLWVDPLEVRMQISIANKELHKSSLKDHLIKKKYGVANDDHIKILKKMCSYADMMELE